MNASVGEHTVKPSPEQAFDEWFRKLGYNGRDDLSTLRPSLRDQLRGLQKMFNDSLQNAKKVPEHADHLPLYFDYIDAEAENALATHDERYAFIGITLPLVYKISDVGRDLSKSAALNAILRIRPPEEDYNQLQGTLFYILFSFIIGHEWTHHVHGHLGHLSTEARIFHEVSNSGQAGGLDVQVKEMGADGYSVYHILANLFENRANFLSFLQFDDGVSSDVLDESFLAFFIVAIAGYMLLRPAPALNADGVYLLTHPPQAARMNFLMHEVDGWCSHSQPALRDWIRVHFNVLMRVTAEAVLGAGGGQVWTAQDTFLRSEAGSKYIAALDAGIAIYRKSWGRTNAVVSSPMESEFLEPPQGVRLQLVPAPDDPPLLSSEYQRELADFANSLRAENIKASTPVMGFDAVGVSGGLSGAFIFAAGTLTPAAFGQVRKLIEAFLAHRGRKIKLTNGAVKIEGSVEDIKALFTVEQIQKLIEPKPQRHLSNAGAVSRAKAGTESSGKPGGGTT